jgi:hypothetical protein
VLEVAQLHAEHRIHLRYLLAARCEFANKLYAVFLVYMERCLDRTIAAEISGIDMPSLLNFTTEDNLALCGMPRMTAAPLWS